MRPTPCGASPNSRSRQASSCEAVEVPERERAGDHVRAAHRGAQRVWAGVLAGGYEGQAGEGIFPSESVEGVHAWWQVAVSQPESRSLSVGLERDLHPALAGRYRQRAVLPAPTEHQPAVGDKLYHLAADPLVAGDVHAAIAA